MPDRVPPAVSAPLQARVSPGCDAVTASVIWLGRTHMQIRRKILGTVGTLARVAAVLLMAAMATVAGATAANAHTASTAPAAPQRTVVPASVGEFHEIVSQFNGHCLQASSTAFGA